jgi:hypothetical protein
VTAGRQYDREGATSAEEREGETTADSSRTAVVASRFRMRITAGQKMNAETRRRGEEKKTEAGQNAS